MENHELPRRIKGYVVVEATEQLLDGYGYELWHLDPLRGSIVPAHGRPARSGDWNLANHGPVPRLRVVDRDALRFVLGWSGPASHGPFVL
jgi:hypothetical protein